MEEGSHKNLKGYESFRIGPSVWEVWKCHRGCPRHQQRPMLKDQIPFPLFGFHLGLDFELGLGLRLVNIQFHSNVSRLRCPIAVSLRHPRSGHYIFYWKALLGSFHSFLFFIPGWHRTMRHILLDLWQTFMDWNKNKIGTSVFIRTHFYGKESLHISIHKLYLPED